MGTIVKLSRIVENAENHHIVRNVNCGLPSLASINIVPQFITIHGRNR